MAIIIVTITCLALIVTGGMMLSHGILTTAASTAEGLATVTTQQSSIARSAIQDLTVESITFDNALRIRVRNTGQVKLADYDHWDVIVHYTDTTGTAHNVWLPYSSGTPADNQWTVAGIWQNGPNDYFDPGIVNPQEDLMIYAPLNPAPAPGSGAEVSVSASNGVSSSLSFTTPTSGELVPHGDTFAITGTEYFYLLDGVPADSANLTETTGPLSVNQTGRWLLYNQSSPTEYARHCFSLNGIGSIPASTWTFTYRGEATGNWTGGNDAQLNVDILVREKDGSVRQTIATGVASANLTTSGGWQTLTATYDFPGYTVANESDLLEVDFYGQSTGNGPSSANSTINLDVDDSALSPSDLTRINY